MGFFDILSSTIRATATPSPNDYIKDMIPKRKGDPLENIGDAIDPSSVIKRSVFGLSLKEAKSTLKEGDHISVQRVGYTHHAIYIGHNTVIHYLQNGIQEDSLEKFSDGYNINIESTSTIYTNKKIVMRAKSRLHEDNYNVLWENCEQFAIWCRRGDKILSS